jgi:hypothetical protein
MTGGASRLRRRVRARAHAPAQPRRRTGAPHLVDIYNGLLDRVQGGDERRHGYAVKPQLDRITGIIGDPYDADRHRTVSQNAQAVDRQRRPLPPGQRRFISWPVGDDTSFRERAIVPGSRAPPLRRSLGDPWPADHSPAVSPESGVPEQTPWTPTTEPLVRKG